MTNIGTFLDHKGFSTPMQNDGMHLHTQWLKSQALRSLARPFLAKILLPDLITFRIRIAFWTKRRSQMISFGILCQKFARYFSISFLICFWESFSQFGEPLGFHLGPPWDTQTSRSPSKSLRAVSIFLGASSQGFTNLCGDPGECSSLLAMLNVVIIPYEIEALGQGRKRN